MQVKRNDGEGQKGRCLSASTSVHAPAMLSSLLMLCSTLCVNSSLSLSHTHTHTQVLCTTSSNECILVMQYVMSTYIPNPQTRAVHDLEQRMHGLLHKQQQEIATTLDPVLLWMQTLRACEGGDGDGEGGVNRSGNGRGECLYVNV
jgi:hypothetical protein